MAPPLIYVFSLAYPPYVGGAEIALQEIMKRLPQYRFRVYTAYALKRFSRAAGLAREERAGNVEIVRVGPPQGFLCQYAYPWFALSRAFRDLRKDPPRALWGMLESYGGMAAYAFHARYPHIPYLLTMQSGDSDAFWNRRTWFWLPVYRKIFRRAARVQAISHYLAARARKFGAPSDTVRVIPNGLALDSFSRTPSAAERSATRKNIGIPDRARCVLTTSRLEYKNGVDILIRGFALWQRAHPETEAVLAIAGRGTLHASLQALVRREGVTERVKFLGEVPYASLPGYYHAADVFARLSRSEGLGNSFLEAMAAGIPVIGTPVGGIPDFLRDGETGLSVPPDDPPAFAGALERLMNDAALKERVVQSGRQLVRERYSWHKIAGEMKALFDELCRVSFRPRLGGGEI